MLTQAANSAMPRRTILDGVRREFTVHAFDPTDDFSYNDDFSYDAANDDANDDANGVATAMEELSISAVGETAAALSLPPDPHAFPLEQDTTAGKAHKKREARDRKAATKQKMKDKRDNNVGRAVYWAPILEMASTVESAKHILEKQGWTGKAYVCIFVGGSTIHIGVVSNEGTIIRHVHVSAKKPSDDIETNLKSMVKTYRKQTTMEDDPEVRVLLAGSPTYVHSRYLAPGDKPFKFFDDKSLPVDCIESRSEMLAIAEHAKRLQEPDGGLSRGEGKPNPGQKILEYIYKAMTSDWIIVCGNRKLTDTKGVKTRRGEPPKPYYCTDEPFCHNHLPPEYDGVAPAALPWFEIVSSGDVNALVGGPPRSGEKEIEKYKKLMARIRGTDGTTRPNGTVLLVTSGFNETDRKAQVEIVNGIVAPTPREQVKSIYWERVLAECAGAEECALAILNDPLF